MGFILTLFLIWLFIQHLTWVYERESIQFSMILCGCVGAVLIFITIGISYGNYVGMMKTKAQLTQYADSIEIYYQRGVEKMANASSNSNEITDFKYGKYQEGITLLLREYRGKATYYNKELAGKRVLNDSWYFNWVIVMPDDTTPVELAQYLKE